jgi:hypothetical protein
MKRCASTHRVPAVRGQKDDKGKPVMVNLACNLGAGHGGPHANEVMYDGSTPKAIRGAWTD